MFVKKESIKMMEKIDRIINNLDEIYELDILLKERVNSSAKPLFEKVYKGVVGVYEEEYEIVLLCDDDEVNILFNDFIAMNVIVDIIKVFKDNIRDVKVEYTKGIYIDEVYNNVVLYFK